jgi:uncharacterized DUF497 family protein
MRISFDPFKSERNARERNLPFESVAEFDFAGAVYSIDDRRDYGETRLIALGLCRDRLHVLCFKEIWDGIRVISFRKANDREVIGYVKAKIADQ